jgi:hypothetical protein
MKQRRVPSLPPTALMDPTQFVANKAQRSLLNAMLASANTDPDVVRLREVYAERVAVQTRIAAQLTAGILAARAHNGLLPQQRSLVQREAYALMRATEIAVLDHLAAEEVTPEDAAEYEAELNRQAEEEFESRVEAAPPASLALVPDVEEEPAPAPRVAFDVNGAPVHPTTETES